MLSDVSNEAVAEKHFSRTIEDELLPGDDFEHYDLLFSDSVSAQTPDYTPDNDDGFADTRSLPDVQAVGIAKKHLSEMTEDELLPGDDFEDYDLLFSETASVEPDNNTTHTEDNFANTQRLEVQSDVTAEKHFSGMNEDTQQAAQDFAHYNSDSASVRSADSTMHTHDGLTNTKLLDVQSEGSAEKHVSSTTEDTPPASGGYEFEDYDLLFPASDSVQTPDDTTNINESGDTHLPGGDQLEDSERKHFSRTAPGTNISRSYEGFRRLRHPPLRRASRQIVLQKTRTRNLPSRTTMSSRVTTMSPLVYTCDDDDVNDDTDNMTTEAMVRDVMLTQVTTATKQTLESL